MAVDLQGLREATARNRSVDGSAAAMIRGIVTQIKAAIVADDLEDAEAINALVDDLDGSTDDLAAAVSENTPAAGGGTETGGGETGGTPPTP